MFDLLHTMIASLDILLKWMKKNELNDSVLKKFIFLHRL